MGERREPGMRVCGYPGFGGAREKVAINADVLVPVPDTVSDETASGITVTYGTGIHGLRDRGVVQAGESVAVLGASGAPASRQSNSPSSWVRASSRQRHPTTSSPSAN
ncbi:MAG: hypothetical protein HC869_26360, partial [Rhodospirillales bacterium]|nr:hypothetical protein [Rhodospirillales bacterium]